MQTLSLFKQNKFFILLWLDRLDMFIVSYVQSYCSIVNINRTETLLVTFKDDFCQNGKKICFFISSHALKKKNLSPPAKIPTTHNSAKGIQARNLK